MKVSLSIGTHKKQFIQSSSPTFASERRLGHPPQASSISELVVQLRKYVTTITKEKNTVCVFSSTNQTSIASSRSSITKPNHAKRFLCNNTRAVGYLPTLSILYFYVHPIVHDKTVSHSVMVGWMHLQPSARF